MQVIGATLVLLLLWLPSFLSHLVGTWLAVRHLAVSKAFLRTGSSVSISILKPLKGMDPGLLQNLESFFKLVYPEFEILFCVGERDDPAALIVEELMKTYPHVRAKLLFSSESSGSRALNPKVQNLKPAYEAAVSDWLLVSDSNVFVEPEYLWECVEGIDDKDVGIVTALVRGRHFQSFAGTLEAAYLHHFFARWMVLAWRFGFPCVLGKSMFFKKSTASRFGGLATLEQYLAEDYMAGRAMEHLGLKVLLMRSPVCQNLSEYSLHNFWSRHLRWSRIRRAQAPIAFFCEIFCSGSLLPAIFLWGALGIKASLIHLLICLLCDAVMMLTLSNRVDFGGSQWKTLRWLFVWAFLQIANPLIWLASYTSRAILWRGNRLEIRRFGRLEAKS